MEIIRSLAEMQAWRRRVSTPVTFVPTMGALHAGHVELLRQAKTRLPDSALVLSIFVNPLQFGPTEDLARYPKPFEKDAEIARTEKVDVLFAPSPSEMYPAGFSTSVEESELSRPLCGKFRPGHFKGVTTVVLKLFNLVRPTAAFFGLKDAQQFFVIKKMVKDLSLDIELIGVPTVREPDGLALSSRNAYLSPEERAKAPLLHAALNQVSTDKETIDQAKARLESNGFTVQYIELLPLPEEKVSILAIAAYLGKTRLIDNLISETAPPSTPGTNSYSSG